MTGPVNGVTVVDYEPILEFLVLLLIAGFTVWGVAGLVLALRNKRSTLRAWWQGSHYFRGVAPRRH